MQVISETAPMRVAVIGVGNMGRNHLRVYGTLKHVDLVGVYDADSEVAAEAARQLGCRSIASLDDVADMVDAVSICSPSTTHVDVGLRMLQAGVHCLIEKPLATSEKDCLALIEAARASNAKLLVGHIERFNPAVQQLSVLLDGNQTVQAIDARRLSSVGRRITDVDVVADLMVHDLDIVMALIKSDVVSIEAQAVSTYGTPGGDHVVALLRFANNSIASLTASRITQNTVRKLAVTTDVGFIDVDYIDQSIEVFLQDKVKMARAGTSRFGDYALDIAMERVQVRRTEPLQMELSHFAQVVRENVSPLVPGEEGLAVLRLVWQIQKCLRDSL
ncbi:MAG: Gfo/Idh/MocA family oxidoreductase [Alphaproteobacteria bacterium]|nr:Gfo/Idh/MocA family oxidoreductase [Alphaproteobacteria bacterium]